MIYLDTSTSLIKKIPLEQEWRTIFPLIHQLQPHLDEEMFHTLVGEMLSQGYEMVGLYVEGKLVAVAGYGVLTNLYFKRHLWLYDLVTASGERSKGYGKTLLTYLEELAKEQGCQTIALCSRFDRVDAHRFYIEKMGYEKASYVIKKSLEI